MVGKRLSHYEILEPLGAGGMGEVYRARDTQLERDVAIKVLPHDVSADPERLARFEREAKLLAQLNHPNIAVIHGLEQAPVVAGEGAAADAAPINFLVMEVAEGRSLAQRVGEGPIEIDEAMKIALQLAEAMEAAHERGIVHRDLKPANVHVGSEGSAAGQVKVLDFGLAKAFEPGSGAASPSRDLSASPTMAAATRTGVIMGTAAYMSPEQARGKLVDKRADIWAFGCVLFEMLTARHAFEGETVTDILAAIVHQEPRWEALPADTPLGIRRLLARCLSKDADERLRDIGECRVAIKEYLADPRGERERALVAARAGRSSWRVTVPVAVAALIVGALAATLWTRAAPELASTVERVERFDIAVPPVRDSYSFAISPDGTNIVFGAVVEGVSRIFRRGLGELEATPIPGTEGGGNPFFDPSGEWIGFFTTDSLEKVPLTGGAPVTICACLSPAPWTEGTWVDDDTIIYGSREGLWRVGTERGSDAELLLPVDPDGTVVGYQYPEAIRGTDWVLFTEWQTPGGAEDDHISVYSLATGATRRLYTGGTEAGYAASGHLLFLQPDRTLMALRFDPQSAELIGDIPVPLMRIYSPLSAWALSANGTLVYVKGDETLASSLHFVWVDREGNPQRMSDFAAPVTAFALSPDETKVAYVVGEEWVAGSLSVLDLARQVPTPVASQVMSLTAGVWAPDGGSIYITDGMGSVQRVFPGTGRAPEQVGSPGILVTDIFDDQQRLVGLDVGSGFSPSGVLLSDVDGGPEAQPQVIEVQRSQYTGLLSEDEDWLLVSAFGGDRTEVWVVRLSGQEARYPVSLSGGSHPRWSPDGDEIFYMDGSDVMAASFDPTADPPLGRPVRLFDASGRYRWRVSPIQGSASVFWPTADGGFLMLTGDEGTAETSEPRVILEKGFFEVLRERLPR